MEGPFNLLYRESLDKQGGADQRELCPGRQVLRNSNQLSSAEMTELPEIPHEFWQLAQQQETTIPIMDFSTKLHLRKVSPSWFSRTDLFTFFPVNPKMYSEYNFKGPPSKNKSDSVESLVKTREPSSPSSVTVFKTVFHKWTTVPCHWKEGALMGHGQLSRKPAEVHVHHWLVRV